MHKITMITLDKLNVGKKAIIDSIIEYDKYKKRYLLLMGLTKGTKITVKKKNNNLITIYLRDYNLTLSTNDAKLIKVGNIN